MKCPYCGANMAPNSQKCGYCGMYSDNWVDDTRPEREQSAAQVVYHIHHHYNDYNEQSAQRSNSSAANRHNQQSRKGRWSALVLCLLFGAFGIHRFYVGKVGTGIIYLLTGGLGGIGAMVDLFLLLFGNFKDKDGDYLR